MTQPDPGLAVDDWFEVAQPFFDAKGYQFTGVQRYDPTVIEGTTPKGAPFTFRVDGLIWKLQYRGRSLTGDLAGAGSYMSAKVQQALETSVALAGG